MANSLRVTFLRRTSLLILAILFFAAANVFGAVVELKSGKTVTGEIVDRNDEFIRIDTGFGFSVTYFMDEIETIEDEPAVSVKKDEAPEVEESLTAAESPATTEIADVVETVEAPETMALPGMTVSTGETGMAQEPLPVAETFKTTETTETAEVIEAAEAPEFADYPEMGELSDETEMVQEPPLVVETHKTLEPVETVETFEAPEPAEFSEGAELPDETEMVEEPPAIEPMLSTPENADAVKEVAPPEMGDPSKEVMKTELPEKPVKDAASATDVATLEGIDLFKEQVSPVAVKPKEFPLSNTADDTAKDIDQQRMAQIDKDLQTFESLPPATEPTENFIEVLMKKTIQYVQSGVAGFKETEANIRRKLPFIQEKLHAIPVKVRRDALLLITASVTFLYILVCLPLMLIARKLGRRHSWLVWIPLVHLVYFVYMAKKPWWLAILFFIPIFNVLMPFILFFGILKLLKRSRWLIVLTVFPVINVVLLWYLAISSPAVHR